MLVEYTLIFKTLENQEIKINQLPNITYIKKNTKFTKNNKVQKDILFFIYIGVFKRIEQ
jgi:hypothetical protein